MLPKWQPKLHFPSPERAYVLLAYKENGAYLLPQVEKQLTAHMGAIDYETQSQALESWCHDYGLSYSHLRLLSFVQRIKREQLVQIRQNTLLLEKKYQEEGQPIVQMDPGYVTSLTVVHTRLREESHHVYLYGGIYAETLLHFENFSFRPLPHAPGHFRHKALLSAFNDIRTISFSN